MATLRERCAFIREQLTARGTATPEELAAYWPGGAENPGKRLWNWIDCHSNYVRFCGRIETELKGLFRSDEARQQAVLDALAERAEQVTLTSKEVDGRPLQLTVYPKGDVALRAVHAANLYLGQLIDDCEALQAAGTALDLELIVRAREEQSYVQRMIVWIATTPGPGLPFAEGERHPELPEEFADLSSIDFYLLANAFQKVNLARLTALDKGNRSKSRPDWSVFFASMAVELNTTPAALMRDWSLAALLATASERARGHEEARQRAELEAKTKPRRAG